MGAMDEAKTSSSGTMYPTSNFFDDDRPRYHIQPPAGWMNDPNGPVFYRGRYHMFYQYLPEACEWDFGIVWGHVVSSDLISWEHLPPALVPTPGWVDADGCFSGCCVIDSSGRPMIMYTGVRLRSNASAGPLPPIEHDLGMVWIESQCIAVPEDEDDELLIRWKKLDNPFLALPPAELDLTGWRDPFVFVANASPLRGHEHGSGAFTETESRPKYRMLMGSGLKGRGGTALVYRSSSLSKGWELEGQLCVGKSLDTGIVWECPLLVPLSEVNAIDGQSLLPPPWLVGSSSNTTAINTASRSRLYDAARETLSRRETSQDASIGAFENQPALPWGKRTMASPAKEAKRSHNMADENSEENPLEFTFSSVDLEQLDKQPSAKLLQSEANTSEGFEGDVSSPSAAESSSPKNLKEEIGNLATKLEQVTNLERSATLGSWATSRTGSSETSSSLNAAAKKGIASVAAEEWTMDDDVSKRVAIESEIDGRMKPESAHASEILERGNDTDDRRDGPGSIDQVEEANSNNAESSHLTSEKLTTATLPHLENLTSNHVEDDIDRFALVQSRMRSVAIAPASKGTSQQQRQQRNARDSGSNTVGTSTSGFSDPNATTTRPPLGTAPSQASYMQHSIGQIGSAEQWHLFTVSPDAPTNPVLYWTGHVAEDRSSGQKGSSIKFGLETAKGPYRLDLGDILYAPNVCQDGRGRWLLWGWLQERRKMGTYNYAGCLSLPRILSCTPDGRLIQSPAPEIALLRDADTHCFRTKDVVLFPDAVFPVKNVRGERLDIECTIDRGNAIAAGLLFRSHEAEAEGSTAIIYDWDRNQLEAIFNVPSNWQPAAATTTPTMDGVEGDIFDDIEGFFDPAAALNTPRYQVSSIASIPAGAASTATTSTLGVAHPPLAKSVVTEDGAASSSRRSSIESNTDSMTSSWVLGKEDRGVSIPGLGSLRRSGSSLSLCLQRASSFAGSTGGLQRMSSMLGRSLKAPSRTTSFVGTPKCSTTLLGASSGLGTSSMPADEKAPGETVPEAEEDLAHLLEDLAAPMRVGDEPAAPPPEPRRVGGGLRMNPSDKLHLRIIVDHSCIEVFAGTGEVLSTRIYRGRSPSIDESGIDFVAFGGAALLKSVEAYEVRSAWSDYEATPRAMVSMEGRIPPAREEGTPMHSMQPSSVRNTPFAAAGTSLRNASTMSLAEELFDEILMDLEPSTSRAVAAK